MWSYYRDESGYVDAVMDHYEQDHAENPDIQQAVAAIQNAQRALDMIFGEMSEAEWDEDEVQGNG
jgi:hypothetical protein